MNRANLMTVALVTMLWVGPAMAATPDPVLTSNIKLSLWTTAGVPSMAVHVDTSEGVVTLYGKVATSEQKALAETATRAVHGVRQVTNLLQIVPTHDEARVAHSDKAVLDAANEALTKDAMLKGSHITAKSVDKGMVLLSGEAHAFGDHLRAVRDTYGVPGVKRVATEVKGPAEFGSDERISIAIANGELMPETYSSATDMRISTSVKLRLLGAAEVPSTEINVDTDDGVVTLFGIVPTEAVKTAARDQAIQVTGVKSVENQLEVVPTSQKKRVEAKDGDIRKDLVLAFKNHPELKRVATEVKNGTVRLTGVVSSAWDELTALRLTRMVPGVRGVENELKTESAGTMGRN